MPASGVMREFQKKRLVCNTSFTKLSRAQSKALGNVPSLRNRHSLFVPLIMVQSAAFELSEASGWPPQKTGRSRQRQKGKSRIFLTLLLLALHDPRSYLDPR